LNWVDFGVGFLVGGILLGSIGLVLAYFAARWALNDRLKQTEQAFNELQADYDYLVDSRNGAKGAPAREAKEDRAEMALIEAATALNELPEGADPKPVIMGLVKKYPDVALKLVKKGVKLG